MPAMSYHAWHERCRDRLFCSFGRKCEGVNVTEAPVQKSLHCSSAVYRTVYCAIQSVEHTERTNVSQKTEGLKTSVSIIYVKYTISAVVLLVFFQDFFFCNNIKTEKLIDHRLLWSHPNHL